MKRRDLLIAGAASCVLPWRGIARAQRDGVVFLEPSQPDFAKHRALFNKRIALTPRVIAVCSSEEGVAEAVRHARKEQLPIALKSGGHCFEGYSLNDGGLVCVFRSMPATGSGACRASVPDDAGPPFRSMPA